MVRSKSVSASRTDDLLKIIKSLAVLQQIDWQVNGGRGGKGKTERNHKKSEKIRENQRKFREIQNKIRSSQKKSGKIKRCQGEYLQVREIWESEGDLVRINISE